MNTQIKASDSIAISWKQQRKQEINQIPFLKHPHNLKVFSYSPFTDKNENGDSCWLTSQSHDLWKIETWFC